MCSVKVVANPQTWQLMLLILEWLPAKAKISPSKHINRKKKKSKFVRKLGQTKRSTAEKVITCNSYKLRTILNSKPDSWS